MKVDSTICSIDCSFDSENIIESWTIKLKNRRVSLHFDGKNFLMFWKHLNKFGEVKRGGSVLTPEAMEAFVHMYVCMNNKPEVKLDYEPRIYFSIKEKNND